MNKEDKRGIFFGVVGVLTLIVAIIGASLAYFSINVNSAKDAVIVQAASVQIVYEHGDMLEVNNIIPSTETIAMATYSRWLSKESTTAGEEYEKCIDDNGNEVCGVYEYTLTNNGTGSVDITARVNQTLNEEGVAVDKDGNPIETQFTNLMYTLYDITDTPKNEDESKGRLGERIGTGTKISTGTVTYTSEGFKILPEELSAELEEAGVATLNGNGSQKVYRLFIWLNEAGELNNPEQGAEFNGTVYIDVVGSGSQNLTGTVDGVE